MRKLLLNTLLIVGFILTANCNQNTEKSQITDESSKVIIAALQFHKDSLMKSPNKTILLDDSTKYETFPLYNVIDEKFTKVITNDKDLSELLSGFGKKIKLSESIAFLNNVSNINTLHLNQIYNLLKPKSWSSFYEKNPNKNGYYHTTLPFINGAGDKAIIYIENNCGGLCGSGYIMVLFKDSVNPKWIVKYFKREWVS